MALLLSAMQSRVRPVASRVLERVAQDAVHPLVGVDLFLEGHFVWRPGLEAAADANVQPLGVLAEHHEIHVGRRPVLQRTQTLVEQPDRPVVHVQVELEARAEQDVAGMPVVGHTRDRPGRR